MRGAYQDCRAQYTSSYHPDKKIGRRKHVADFNILVLLIREMEEGGRPEKYRTHRQGRDGGYSLKPQLIFGRPEG